MKKIKLKKGQIYKFEWIDTYSHLGWFNDDDLEDMTQSVIQTTIGIFVKQNKDWLIVATHKNNHDDFKPWGSPCWIPKKCIKTISSF